MKSLIFEWDEYKNKSNQKKHKISFEEAATVFVDELARLIPDPDHFRRRRTIYIDGNEFKTSSTYCMPL